MPTDRGGRPTLRRDDLVDRLIGELERGTSLNDAARIAGVGARTVRTWRSRAWSRDPADQPFVRLERRVQAALLRSRTRPAEPEPEPEPEWATAARQLMANAPERWGTPAELADFGIDLADVDAILGPP